METSITRTLWILWAVTLNHLLWAVCLAVSESVVNVTSVTHVAHVFGGRWTTCVGLAVISIAAGAGLLLRNRMLSLSCLLPQQFLVIASAMSAISSIRSGAFADGVERGSAFLAADQGLHVLLAITHSLSLIELHCWELVVIAKLKWKAK